jgi:hypothetical protein
MKPGALADALAINIHVLRYQMKPFLESGALAATGATLNRLVHVGRTKASVKRVIDGEELEVVWDGRKNA